MFQQEYFVPEGQISEFAIEEICEYFKDKVLLTQSAGIWLYKPLIVPIDIGQFVQMLRKRGATRISVVKMDNGTYFLNGMNIS